MRGRWRTLGNTSLSLLLGTISPLMPYGPMISRASASPRYTERSTAGDTAMTIDLPHVQPRKNHYRCRRRVKAELQAIIGKIEITVPLGRPKRAASASGAKGENPGRLRPPQPSSSPAIRNPSRMAAMRLGSLADCPARMLAMVTSGAKARNSLKEVGAPLPYGRDGRWLRSASRRSGRRSVLSASERPAQTRASW